jgi:hypothetical protein
MACPRPDHLAVLLAALALAPARDARAQGVAPPVTLGLQIGYSESGFVGGADSASESRSGTLFGVFADRRLAGPLGARIELFFAKKGGGFTTAVGGVPISISAQLVYLEVPLLARLTIPVGSRRVRPVVFGGGSASFNIGCEFQAETPGQVVQVGCNDSAGTGVPLRGVDFGAIVGGGLEYAWRTSALRVEFREVFGLRRILADDVLKNRTWALLVGVTF